MNNQSPLIPSGSLLEQRNKGRARVKIAVFLVLAIHGVGLMALLMQGCNKKDDATANNAAAPSDSTNTPAPTFVEPTNTPAAPTNLITPPTNAAVTPPPIEPVQPITAPPPTAASDYVIVKGDTFSTVAKKFHVSVKALLDANPSVEPTKLKIGQTIHIPAAPTAVTAGTAGTIGASTADAGAAGQTYSVKSGDSLTKIAGEFGVSVKALRSANNLKTDKIVVGQKLKIPAKSSSQPASTTSTPSPASGTQ
jgi:LysM repeat protein